MTNPTNRSGSGSRGEFLSPADDSKSQMLQFRDYVNNQHQLRLTDYESLHEWSVSHYQDFWTAISNFFAVPWHDRPTAVVQPAGRKMPGQIWWPGGTLNYAEMILQQAARLQNKPAVVAISQSRERVEFSWCELAALVDSYRQEMISHGLSVGDGVAAYLPNSPEAVAIFLAAASLGVTFSSCPPEFGAEAVISRFGQFRASLLYVCERYTYGSRDIEKSTAIASVVASMLSLRAVVRVDLTSRDELSVRTQQRVNFSVVPVPAHQPLYVLYSSGTTGLPKAIVHSHGGILHEHLKVLSLHHGLETDQRFFWYSTTGWMMWNYLVSGLLVGSSLVLFDGDPAYPDLGALWRLARDERINVFGVGASFIHNCMKAGLRPRDLGNLSELRIVGSTGSPLTADGFRWVSSNVGEAVRVHSISGGTDVCSAFVGMSPMLPVRAGEISCSILGADVRAFRADGSECPAGETGELVITTPMPSMPVGFLNDPSGKKYRDAYFSEYPGIWRHGDWITVAADGSCIVSGRSDATLNRGGVRLGTSEFYGVVESMETIADSLIVHLSDETDDGKLLLFVVVNGGNLSHQIELDLRDALRSRLSPRHVPNKIIQVAGIPRTLSGKKLEIPVKKILLGSSPDEVCSRNSLVDPNALDEYVRIREALAIRPSGP